MGDVIIPKAMVDAVADLPIDKSKATASAVTAHRAIIAALRCAERTDTSVRVRMPRPWWIGKAARRILDRAGSGTGRAVDLDAAGRIVAAIRAGKLVAAFLEISALLIDPEKPDIEGTGRAVAEALEAKIKLGDEASAKINAMMQEAVIFGTSAAFIPDPVKLPTDEELRAGFEAIKPMHGESPAETALRDIRAMAAAETIERGEGQTMGGDQWKRILRAHAAKCVNPPKVMKSGDEHCDEIQEMKPGAVSEAMKKLLSRADKGTIEGLPIVAKFGEFFVGVDLSRGSDETACIVVRVDPGDIPRTVWVKTKAGCETWSDKDFVDAAMEVIERIIKEGQE